MIYNSIEEIYQSLDSTRGKLLKVIESLPAEKRTARENADGWSISEIVEHIGIVEGGITRIIEKLLGKAENEGRSFDGIFNPPLSLGKIIEFSQEQKFKAPERVYPQGFQTIEESLSILSKNRSDLKLLQKRIEGVDSSEQKFPHPALGDLNPYQWLAVINFHEYRHLQQIERILSRFSKY